MPPFQWYTCMLHFWKGNWEVSVCTITYPFNRTSCSKNTHMLRNFKSFTGIFGHIDLSKSNLSDVEYCDMATAMIVISVGSNTMMVMALKSFKTLQNKTCTTYISYQNRRARDDLNKKEKKLSSFFIVLSIPYPPTIRNNGYKLLWNVLNNVYSCR